MQILGVARRLLKLRSRIKDVFSIILLIKDARRRLVNRDTGRSGQEADPDCEGETHTRLIGLLQVIQVQMCRAGVDTQLDNVLLVVLAHVMPKPALHAMNSVPPQALQYLPHRMVAGQICNLLKNDTDKLVIEIRNLFGDDTQCQTIIESVLASPEMSDFSKTVVGTNYAYLQPLLDRMNAVANILAILESSRGGGKKPGRKQRGGTTPHENLRKWLDGIHEVTIEQKKHNLTGAEIAFLLLYHSMEIDPSATALALAKLASAFRAPQHELVDVATSTAPRAHQPHTWAAPRQHPAASRPETARPGKTPLRTRLDNSRPPTARPLGQSRPQTALPGTTLGQLRPVGLISGGSTAKKTPSKSRKKSTTPG